MIGCDNCHRIGSKVEMVVAVLCDEKVMIATTLAKKRFCGGKIVVRGKKYATISSENSEGGGI